MDIIRSLYKSYKRLWASVNTHYTLGTNVFSREWDLLVILDTCRVDALRAVAPEYDFLTGVGAITSVGSSSLEWVGNTFTTEYLSEIRGTACVTSNAYMEKILRDRNYITGTSHLVHADDLSVLDQPWMYVPDEEKPFVHTPPRYITDRAIAVGRDHVSDRLLVHYTPPHSPYTAAALKEGRDELKPYEADPFQALRDGVSYETVWEAYLDELRLALDEVELLLENVDADRVVISADHGEAFGEYGIYSHPTGMLHPKIRRVPWAETTATDTGTYEPTAEARNSDAAREAKSHLEDLGYLV
jgi:hypothetical protein